CYTRAVFFASVWGLSRRSATGGRVAHRVIGTLSKSRNGFRELRRRGQVMLARLVAMSLVCHFLALTGAASHAGETFSWQQTYAKVLPHGDLEWTPTPFRFDQGASLRYIDFDG